MSTNGILDFQNTNKVIFRGTDSNVVVDTSNASIGIGIQGTEKPGSNLHVIGDASISSNLKLTTDTSITVNSNVVTDFNGPHARLPKEVPLKKYPEINFDGSIGNFVSIPDKGAHNQSTNTYIIGGHKVVASSEVTHSSSRMSAWKLFDSGVTEGEYSGWGLVETFNAYNAANPGEYPSSGTARLATTDVDGNSIETGGWIYIKLPNKIKLKHYSLKPWGIANRYGVADYPKEFYIYASNDGTNWKLINSQTNPQTPSVPGSTASSKETISYDVSQTGLGYYSYYAMTIRKINSVAVQAIDNAVQATFCVIGDWKLFGYEEDPPAGDISVDTTFKSVMNTPQTTGANVYVDAKLSSDFTNQVTGPTPVGTAATHDNTNKYWEMNGQLTSNITIEANTFLEGDQPHAVSVWFNSSNLEANVSNTCVFSISDQEKLDSVNLDLQPNTWHNLTYAYQGEGGSRVTYLDGRKVTEEQAEDTFGDYPPFAMTGYSQGGYVVSASTEYTTYSAWNGFDEIQSANGIQNHWSGSSQKYSTSDGNFDPAETGSVYTTNVEGVNKYGEWLQIEFPHKIKYNYSKIKAPYDRAERQPRDGYIVGSNDLSGQWTTLHRFTGVTRSSATETVTYTPSSAPTNAFKYIRIVIEAITASTGRYAGVDEWDIYGHHENDLVRLPDPTNVLKYPHIAMTGPARRGYVASASGNHSNGNHPTWKAFDGVITNDWQIDGGRYSNSGGVYTHNAGETTVTNVQSRVGDWVQLESPHKIRVKTMKFTPIATYGQERSPATGVLVGSNDDGSTWTEIKVFDVTTDGTPTSYTAASPTTLAIDSGSNSNPGYYKIHRLIWLTLYTASQTTYADRASVADLELYGTGVDSIPIQIGGGNIDKVANFRVYNKFIDEDQALEIWDAQKEEFGRAKSSATLHKGRLGIGTDAPQGSLSVADEPHNVEEFPPRALSADKTYIEGHGEFCTSVSEIYPNAYAYKAFNKIQSGSGLDFHWSANTAGYDNVTGAYTGTSDFFTNVEGQIALGHWIQIEFPYKINYRYSEIQGPDHAVGRQPHTGYIVGSNDLSGVWTSLHNYSGMTRTGARDFVTYTPPTISTQSFKYFRLVIEKMGGGNTHAGVSQWHIFGTREQGQSVLHDGQLTLMKSLNVPRIGPSLDVDDTPRRDRLVVEYNTSTNPAFEGGLRDTSGRGNDGVFYGGSTMKYNANKKALVFDGTDDIIEADLGSQIFKNSSLHTTSLWVKMNEHSSDAKTFFSLGNGLGNPNGNLKHVQLFHADNYGLRLSFTHHDYRVGEVVPVGQWVHVAYTFDGTAWQNTTTPTNVNIYINGTKVGITSIYQIGGGGGTLDLSTAKLGLGASTDFAATNDRQFCECDISNLKLYDVVLTAEEVKTLYDMGRCDEGHHVVNFSKTRVGIGLGDGEVPSGDLDVRGHVCIGPNVVPKSQWFNPALTIIQHSKGRGNGRPGAGIQFGHIDEPGHGWMIGTDNDTTSGAGTGNELVWEHLSNGIQTGYGAQLSSGYTVNTINDFTGQHRCFIKDVPFSQVSDLEGLIVSSDQNKYIKMSGGIEAGSNAITTNESLPVVSLSNVMVDKKCFGVISAAEDSKQRVNQFGNIKSFYPKEKGDTRVHINSVGEGAIWVANTNGSLEAGDYITTSNVAGYGQKQDSAGLMNYTVAKITMDCDFEPATQPIQIIKKDEEGENVLDEHGQIQWEDHPTETEKAYKVRYLTADGTQTDEANAVHITAFVGCTYHCG